MDRAKENRQSPKEIILCEDLSFRFTYNIRHIKHLNSQQDKCTRLTNELHMYLYNRKLKVKVGPPVIKQYHFTKKERTSIAKQSASALTPETDPRIPPTDVVEQAMVSVIEKNFGMEQHQVKGRKTMDFDDNKLAVYWIMHSNDICNATWKSPTERENVKVRMMHLIVCCGDQRLSDLKEYALAISKENSADKVAELGANLQEYCRCMRSVMDEVVGNGTYRKKHLAIIKACFGDSVKHEDPVSDPRESTNTMDEYKEAFRALIVSYLKEANLDPVPVLKIYAACFRKKPLISSVLRSSMVPKSLSRDQYRAVYKLLTTPEEAPAKKAKAKRTRQEKKSAQQEIAARDPAVSIAILMMLFMGLSAEEVCALDKSDRHQIEGYSDCTYVCITKECRKNHGSALKRSLYSVHDIIDSVDSRDTEVYYLRCRNVPIPKDIRKIMPRGKSGDCDALLCDKNGKRLSPQVIQIRLATVFNEPCKSISVTTPRGKTSIPLNFKPQYYLASLEHLWAQFGLRDGEIRYLLGHAQIQTAAKHYIDYNNPHVMYAMYTHMSFTVNNIATDRVAYTEGTQTVNIMGNDTKELKHLPDWVRHTHIKIMQPLKLDLASDFSIHIVKGGSKP